MKKSLFSVLALVFCTFAILSCDKDDKKDDNRKEGADKYLTLVEQQEKIGSLSQQLAEKIDLTPVQDALTMLSGLEDLPFDQIAEAARKDRVFGQIIDQFEEMESTDGNVVLDLSKMNYRFKLNFVPQGVGATGTVAVTPVFELLSSNHDRFQIDMDHEGHLLSLWLKGEGNMTTVQYSDEEESHDISVPNTIILGLDCDGSSMLGATLNTDTDLKITYHKVYESLDSYDGNESYYTINCGRLNLNVTLNVVQYALNASFQYSPDSGLKVSAILSDIASKLELLKVNAGLDGTLKKEMRLDESELMAWIMDTKSCRKLWADVSLLSEETSFKVTLDNPFDGIPAKDRAEYMSYMDSEEGMPEEMRLKLINQIMPYLNNGIYFKGYNPAQSKVVVKATDGGSMGLFVESCDPKSEESMPLGDFFLTDKVSESLAAIVQKVLPIVGMFKSVK